jgi:hypothetical protein
MSPAFIAFVISRFASHHQVTSREKITLLQSGDVFATNVITIDDVLQHKLRAPSVSPVVLLDSFHHDHDSAFMVLSRSGRIAKLQ